MVGAFFSLIVSLLLVASMQKSRENLPLVLLASLLLFTVSYLLGRFEPTVIEFFLPENFVSTGTFLFDLFALVAGTAKKVFVQVGLLAMIGGAYVHYMSRLGANARLADLCYKPLSLFDAHYLVLSLVFLIGTMMDIVIGRATGIGLMFLSAVYPILIRAGISRHSAIAIIATVSCLDIGPASRTAMAASGVTMVNIGTYVIDYQIPIAFVCAVGIAIVHFFTQRHYDEKEGEAAFASSDRLSDFYTDDFKERSVVFALLPLLPLIYALIFNPIFFDTIRIDPFVSFTAAFFTSFLVDLYFSGYQQAYERGADYLNELGRQFSTTVVFLIGASLFSEAIVMLGSLDYIILFLQSLALPEFGMMFVMVCFFTLATFLMGSAYQPFLLFGPLLKDFARNAGVAVVFLTLPVQFASGLTRAMSPFSPVIIALSFTVGISPFKILRRTVLPMAVGLMLVVLANMYLYTPDITLWSLI